MTTTGKIHIPKEWLTSTEILRRGTFGSRMSLWRAVQAGRFPPAAHLGPRMRAWRRSAVEAFEMQAEQAGQAVRAPKAA